MRARHWAMLLAMLTVITRGVDARLKRDANDAERARGKNLGLAVGQAQSVIFSKAASEGPPAESAEPILYIVKTSKDGVKHVGQKLKSMLEPRAIHYVPFDSFLVSMTAVQSNIIAGSRGCLAVYLLPWVRRLSLCCDCGAIRKFVSPDPFVNCRRRS